MAITGIVGMGFVLAHMIGNLKMYLGAEARRLRDQPLRRVPARSCSCRSLPRTVALWLMRFGLIAALLLHMHAAYGLTVINRRARPVKYQCQRDYIAANFASRTMRWTGIIVLLFLVLHLADLTWGWVNPDFVRGDVYGNVVPAFAGGPSPLLYIVANIALGIHLFHGAWSLFQSMGWSNPRFNLWRRPRHRLRHRSSWSATSRSPSPCSPASSRSDRSRHG